MHSPCRRACPPALSPQTAARLVTGRGAAANAAADDGAKAPAAKPPLRLKIDAEDGEDNVWLDRAQLADMLAALSAAARPEAAKTGEAGEANGAAVAAMMGRLQGGGAADKIIRVCGVRSFFSPALIPPALSGLSARGRGDVSVAPGPPFVCITVVVAAVY